MSHSQPHTQARLSPQLHHLNGPLPRPETHLSAAGSEDSDVDIFERWAA